jgi:hypothetical protein
VKPGIELVVRLGRYGERVETIALDLGDSVVRELSEPMELSDDPMSVLLASPGMFGGKGDAVTVRKRAFAMRRDTAKLITAAIEDALFKAFGANDQVNGYRREDWSERDRAQADYTYRKRS